MNTLKTILATVGGIGAGLAVGYLTAPRSGKKTREMISDDVNMRRDNLEKAMNERLEEVRELINSAVHRGAENGQEALEKAKSKS